MKRNLLIVTTLALVSLCATAQEVIEEDGYATILPPPTDFVWSVDAASVINNREGGDEGHPDQTFLFTRLTPEIGVRISSEGACHELRGGATWFQPLSGKASEAKVTPLLYYHYKNNKWNFDMGLVPRKHILPHFLRSDSINYHQTVVRGLVASYSSNSLRPFDATLILDWRQMQTERRREAFNITFASTWNFSGRWDDGSPKDNLWYLSGLVQYNHLAKRKNAPEGEGVNDDITLNPMIVYLHSVGERKWLKIGAGAIINLERARVDECWHTPTGFYANAGGQYNWFEASEEIYAGKPLFPLYERFGAELNMGDPYFNSKFYSRTDLTAHIVQRSFVDLSFSLTFHATDKITGFWQQLACRFYFNGTGKGVEPNYNTPLKSNIY